MKGEERKMRINQLAMNQTVVLNDRKAYFFSYETLIARVDGVGRCGEVFIRSDFANLSKTTSKWLHVFLQGYSCISPAYCTKKGLQALMKTGEVQALKEEE